MTRPTPLILGPCAVIVAALLALPINCATKAKRVQVSEKPVQRIDIPPHPACDPAGPMDGWCVWYGEKE